MYLVKEHTILRKEMFVPTGENDYPFHNNELEAVRITIGKTESGKNFEIEDSWRRPGRANRLLDERWTGKTLFRLKASAQKKYRVEIEPRKDRLRKMPMRDGSRLPGSGGSNARAGDPTYLRPNEGWLP